MKPLRPVVSAIPCFLFTSGDASKLLEISTKNILSPRGIVRLTVEWFLSRENNRWFGWKRITQDIRIFDGR